MKGKQELVVVLFDWVVRGGQWGSYGKNQESSNDDATPTAALSLFNLLTAPLR